MMLSIQFAMLMVLQAPVDSAAIARIDSAATTESRAGFSGVVLVAQGDTVLLEKAYGRVASSGNVSTPAFWLASDSKQFTAAAILRLEQSGRLRVTDSISRFFSNVPTDKRGITVHQLLAHTSGLPHEYEADGIADREEAVARTLSLKLKFAPGARYSYSNDGYTLLAAIVDSMSGVGFDRFVVDSLFARAGMKHASTWGFEKAGDVIAPVADEGRARRTSGKVYRDGKSVANWGYRGPTGTYATATDVHRWIQALRTGKILNATEYAKLIGRHIRVNQDSTGESYGGYGWGVRVENGRDVSYGHSGNEDWLGHNALIRFTPEGMIVVVLSNSGDKNGSGWSSIVNRAIRRAMVPSGQR